MDAQLSAKFQKKVMNQFWETANTNLPPKNWICHFLAFMDAQLSAKFQNKVMDQFWGTVYFFLSKWAIFGLFLPI